MLTVPCLGEYWTDWEPASSTVCPACLSSTGTTTTITPHHHNHQSWTQLLAIGIFTGSSCRPVTDCLSICPFTLSSPLLVIGDFGALRLLRMVGSVVCWPVARPSQVNYPTNQMVAHTLTGAFQRTTPNYQLIYHSSLQDNEMSNSNIIKLM